MVLNSRDRVNKALNHEEPNHPPLDLGSTPNTTITKIAYNNLRKYLGMSLDSESLEMSRTMQLVGVDEPVLERFHIDTRSILANPPDKSKSRQIGEDIYIDEWGIKCRAAKRCGKVLYYDIVEHPLSDVTTVQDIEKYGWPDPCNLGRTQGLKEKAKTLRQNLNYAMVGHMGDTSIFETCWYLRGMEQFFSDLMINKKMAKALLEKVFEVQSIKMEKYLNEVGRYLDVVSVGDDISGQLGPLISPSLYREMIKPYHKAYFELIKSKTSAKLHLHSCGTVQYFLDDFIEIGVDIINPVQVSAKGMDPKMLKERYGDRISFWGGIDTQHILPNGNPKEVINEVSRMVQILGKGGGYVVSAVHNIQPDVPPENIVAMYDAVLGETK